MSTKLIKKFLSMEASSSIILAFSALVAFLIANTKYFSDYQNLLHYRFFNLSLHHWINDGLMAIFFFLVGLEIKKEITTGELSTVKKAAFPVVAALGGIIFPALIYLYFNTSYPQNSGWGIPMATDIAFAVGVLTLFGRQVPLTLKILLLAIAIVDDLGAILVIAFFYTNEIKSIGLLVSLAAVIFILLLRHLKITSYLVYTIFGFFVWLGFLYSGVHATIAGVILGLLTPTVFSHDNKMITPADDLIHKVHPYVSYGIMPVFAFANSGINISNIEFSSLLSNSVHQGILFGLVVGKPLGIFISTYIFWQFKIIDLPLGLKWNHILAAGCLAGIGFTMSLFISNLALPVALEVYSKTAIILASVVSGLIGAFILKPSLKKEVYLKV